MVDDDDLGRLDLLRAQVEQLHAMLDTVPTPDIQSIIELSESTPDSLRGMHRVVMMNLVRRGLDQLAIEYAAHFGLTEPPLTEAYVGPLDEFVCFALASARRGNYEPSRELFVRLRPVRAVEEFFDLIDSLPHSELDLDAVAYGYGIWCMQELISGKTHSQQDSLRKKWDEVRARRDDATESE